MDFSNHSVKGFTAGARPEGKSLSRVESDTETVKRMVTRVVTINARILSHAQQLGYWHPEPAPPSTAQLEPVTVNLADALRELDKVIDVCSSSLNCFD